MLQVFWGLLFTIASLGTPGEIIASTEVDGAYVFQNVSQNVGASVTPAAVTLRCAGDDHDTVLLVIWCDDTPAPLAVGRVWFATLTTPDPLAWGPPAPVPASIEIVAPGSLRLVAESGQCAIRLVYQAEVEGVTVAFAQTYAARTRQWSPPVLLRQVYLPAGMNGI